MIGIVDVGGGMRGSFGAGVFDWCLGNGVSFDNVYGVSAGSANAVAYLGRQAGRNLRYYRDYSMRPEYMSLKNFVKTGSYLNLRYIYGTLSNSDGEDPLDYPAMVKSGKNLCVVATSAETGEPFYFGLDDFHQDDYRPLDASSCIPIINKPVEVNGVRFFDGAFSDPIPVQKAFDDGCDKVVVILTRPKDYYRDPNRDRPMELMLKRDYPEFAEKAVHRAEIYNKELNLAKYYQREGKAIIVAPDTIKGMKSLKKDPNMIQKLYRKGVKEAASIANFL